MNEDETPLISFKTGTCRRCGRDLFDPLSIRAGIGPVCKTHEAEEAQMDLWGDSEEVLILG